VTGVIRRKVDLAGLVDVYELVVLAVDHGSPALSGSAIVTITVLSHIKQPPRWVTPPTDDYVQYIREVIPVLLSSASNNVVMAGISRLFKANSLFSLQLRLFATK